MSARHTGFDAVVGDEPRVLILGTFPGRASREKKEYYGFGRNQFWELLFTVLGQPFNAPSYAEKLALLRARRIALWDIVASCETEGSADTQIKAPELIDLHGFLQAHPTIGLVCFNGTASSRYAARLGAPTAPSVVLPSTSPANASMSRAEKLGIWTRALREGGVV